MRAQYGVTAEEVFSYVDGAMFWEASFGFRPADCYVTAAGKQKEGRAGTRPAARMDTA